MGDNELSPEDFTMESTGRLSRHDDEIEPGDIVAVETFQVKMSPKVLAALGITAGMTQEEMQERLLEVWTEAARKAGLPVMDDER